MGQHHTLHNIGASLQQQDHCHMLVSAAVALLGVLVACAAREVQRYAASTDAASQRVKLKRQD